MHRPRSSAGGTVPTSALLNVRSFFAAFLQPFLRFYAKQLKRYAKRDRTAGPSQGACLPCLVRRMSFPNMSGTKSCTESIPSGSLVKSLTFFIHRAPAATKPGGSWLLPATLQNDWAKEAISLSRSYESLEIPVERWLIPAPDQIVRNPVRPALLAANAHGALVSLQRRGLISRCHA